MIIRNMDRKSRELSVPYYYNRDKINKYFVMCTTYGVGVVDRIKN